MLAPATAWTLRSRLALISFLFGSWTILFIFGHVRDFFRKRLGSAKESGYAPIRLGYEDFYVRRMYQRIHVRVDFVYRGWNTMGQIGFWRGVDDELECMVPEPYAGHNGLSTVLHATTPSKIRQDLDSIIPRHFLLANCAGLLQPADHGPPWGLDGRSGARPGPRQERVCVSVGLAAYFMCKGRPLVAMNLVKHLRHRN